MRDQPHYLLRRNWPDLCSMADPFAAADDPPPVAADPFAAAAKGSAMERSGQLRRSK